MLQYEVGEVDGIKVLLRPEENLVVLDCPSETGGRTFLALTMDQLMRIALSLGDSRVAIRHLHSKGHRVQRKVYGVFHDRWENV